MAAITKTDRTRQAVRKIHTSLETSAGKLPGSRRVKAGPRLTHKGGVVVRGNLPNSRRYLGSVNAGEIYRDDLIEALLEAYTGAGIDPDVTKDLMRKARKEMFQNEPAVRVARGISRGARVKAQKVLDFVHGRRQLRKLKKK